MTARIQLRRGTAAQWASSNPVLQPGEPGYATDTQTLKIGNGVDPWTALTGIVGGIGGDDGPITYDDLPAGTTLTVIKSGSTWPARPTARGDIVVIWKGPDPSPTVVTSGTGGMRDGVDERKVT